MRIVAENSETDIAKRHAEMQAQSNLRELAANLLRVVRGAGRPEALGQQAAAFVHALYAYQEAFGHYPSADVHAAAIRIEECTLDLDEGEHVRMRGQEMAVRGALQIAASELLGQRTQQRAGESELFDGFRMMEQGREMVRAQFNWPSTKAEASAQVREAAAALRAQARSKGPKV